MPYTELEKNRRREFYKKNKEEILSKRKVYYENNKEKIYKIQKNYSEKNKEYIKKYRKKYREKNIYKYCISNAKKRNKQLDYDESYLIELFKKQNGRCFWTNLKMIEKGSHNNPFQISVDRLDNNKTYAKDNIVLCCLMINYARNTCDYETWNDIMKNQISIKYRRKKS